jgi:hypothetical protein
MFVVRSGVAAVIGAGLMALAACGGSSDSAADGGAGGSGSSTGGTGALVAGKGGSAAAGQSGSSGANLATDQLYGTFTLRLSPAAEATATTAAVAAQTSFIGFVTEGPTPVANRWVEAQSANGCTLYTPKAPFCDPACGSSAVCVSDDKCENNATPKAVGNITLKGLANGDVTMSPLGANSNYQPKAGVSLPYPPCAEGAAVSLAVEGGSYKAFELAAKCIAPLEFKGPLKLVKGSAAKLEWTAPGDKKLARMTVRLDISHHGGSRGKIECDVEDSGSLELPADMVGKLLDLGVAGYPTVILTRALSGGAASGEPKNVQLLVQEAVERTVEIDGLLSCTENSQCPSPKTCQADLTCK